MSRELRVGDEMPEVSFTIDGWRMTAMSVLMRDPNPIHVDAAAVAALGGGDRPVAQGTLTFAYPIDVLVEWLGGDDAVGRVARVTCRYLASGLAGDTVRAGGRVTDVDVSGVATLEVWLARGEVRLLGGHVTVRPPAAR